MRGHAINHANIALHKIRNRFRKLKAHIKVLRIRHNLRGVLNLHARRSRIIPHRGRRRDSAIIISNILYCISSNLDLYRTFPIGRDSSPISLILPLQLRSFTIHNTNVVRPKTLNNFRKRKGHRKTRAIPDGLWRILNSQSRSNDVTRHNHQRRGFVLIAHSIPHRISNDADLQITFAIGLDVGLILKSVNRG